MGIKQSLKSFIGSNGDAFHNNMFSRPLMPHKDGSLGAKATHDATTQSWKDMREADKVVRGHKDTMGETKAAYEQAVADGDEKAIKKLGRQMKKEETMLGDHQTTAKGHSEAFGKNAWDYAKVPLNYMSAKDYAGKDGRAMAIAARGTAVGAAWMGLNGAGRAITGGGMTYNNTGERDIAGIPFI